MPFDYATLKSRQFEPVRQELTARDVIAYSLGVGYGYDPTDEHQLPFVYEADLAAPPTMAAVLAHPGFWMKDPATGVDWKKVLHAEQRIALHGPLPVGGTVVGRNRIKAIVDKGPDKGAIVYQERTVESEGGALLATVEQTVFCRGDGGLDASDAPPPPPAAPPDTPPDEICDLPTMPQSALLYRLSGDTNPLHADPAVAAAAGFPRPILHGLCTYGVAGHAVLRTYCDYDPAALTGLFARFSAPVFPGETIRTELWRRDGSVAFRSLVVERGVVVLSHGHATLA